ncbi:MAG: hypothetical protein AB4911_15380 [Oscillochloridaceae bacterium umkhey_bin13]
MARLQPHKSAHQPALVDWLAMAMVSIISITLFVTWYVTQEAKLYYWDDAAYHNMTQAKAVELASLPLRQPAALSDGLTNIWLSTAREYSDFHTLPIVPVMLLFGDGRLTYILALALFYIVPYVLITAALAARLVPTQPRLAAWFGMSLALLTPAVWLPTLRGYPDIAAAALIGLAAWFYLADPRMAGRSQRWLIGLCLAAAVLFRRHFAYDLITLGLSVGLVTMFVVGRETIVAGRSWLAAIWIVGLRLAEMVLATLVALALLGWPFIARVVSTDFGALYSSYQVSASTNVFYYQWYYGLVMVTLALFGFIAGSLHPRLCNPAILFSLLFLLISVAQWFLRVQQLGVHYTLHFSLWLILGLVAAASVLSLSLRGTGRIVAVSLMAGLLLVTMISAFGPYARFGLGRSDYQGLALFPASYRPAVRSDYAELLRLVDYLQATAPSDAPIYVAASSEVLSGDHLWQLQRNEYEDVLRYTPDTFWQSQGLNVIQWPPFADSRDPYPLDLLLDSAYVVIASPTQYHLRPSEQQVVTVVTTIFTDAWEFAADFAPLPEQFVLGDGVVVTIYERLRPTSTGVAVRTLHAIEAFMMRRPGGQLSWLDLNAGSQNYISATGLGQFTILFEATAPLTWRHFLWLDELAPANTLRGTLRLSDPRSGPVSVAVRLVDRQGREVSVSTTQQFMHDEPFTLPFDPSAADAQLFLSVLYPPTATQLEWSCWISLEQLVLVDIGAGQN